MSSHLLIIFFSSFIAFVITIYLSPIFIKILQKLKLNKNIREKDSTWRVAEIFRALHLKKKWTPTMWWVLIWWTVLFVILISRALAFYWIIPESLLDRWEVYLPLFTLITMWILWAIDDYLNIIESKNKWLAIKPKAFFIMLFWILWGLWFYYKLWSHSQSHHLWSIFPQTSLRIL